MPTFNWGLTVATYNRADCLQRCVELAATQTRPPTEFVIVDASPDWEASQAVVTRIVSDRLPNVPCTYVPARVRSLTHQRNQALELASADVLFMIDDDSFMFPDCASEIMSLYDADPSQQVAGVSARLSASPPGEKPADTVAHATPNRAALDRLEKRLVKEFVDFYWRRLVLPYDGAYPDREIPAGVLEQGAERIRYIEGCCMTYRRRVFADERFCEHLTRYAAGEDLDASYRISRHGALVLAPRGWLFHAKSPIQRLTRYTSTILGLTNFAFLYRLYGRDPKQLLRQFRSGIRRRALVDVVTDLGRRRWTLPRVRADYDAYRALDAIEQRASAELAEWYYKFQLDLIERNAP